VFTKGAGVGRRKERIYESLPFPPRLWSTSRLQLHRETNGVIIHPWVGAGYICGLGWGLLVYFVAKDYAVSRTNETPSWESRSLSTSGKSTTSSLHNEVQWLGVSFLTPALRKGLTCTDVVATMSEFGWRSRSVGMRDLDRGTLSGKTRG
jgi:hypothetical protein